MEFSRQEYWSQLPFPPPGDLPNPGIKPESPAFPALTGDFFILNHWGSSQDIGMGSYSLLQGIFPTQGSNLDFLHCRQILYCLSHQGIPRILELGCYFLLQGNFLIQGSNPHLLPWQVNSLHWATTEAPKTMSYSARRAAVRGVTKSRTRLSDWIELNWTDSTNQSGENHKVSLLTNPFISNRIEVIFHSLFLLRKVRVYMGLIKVYLVIYSKISNQLGDTWSWY